ncbi:MAG: hypothetical protein LBC53_03555 [Spirochaetaceae bacterium]|jgi:hypothetical protein|nr:hypothetical protein [Spirochaetaceae bacterium]
MRSILQDLGDNQPGWRTSPLYMSVCDFMRNINGGRRVSPVLRGGLSRFLDVAPLRILALCFIYINLFCFNLRGGASLFALETEEKALFVKKEIYAAASAGFDSSFYQNYSFDLLSNLELNKGINIKSAFSFWVSGEAPETSLTLGGSYIFPLYKKLSFCAMYNFTNIPVYKNKMHVILPFVLLSGERSGVSLGAAFRFSSFYGQYIFEPNFNFSVYYEFIRGEKYTLTAYFENFDDYKINNFNSYYIKINSVFKINEKLSLKGEVYLLQSGSGGLSADYYGTTLKIGASVLW